MTPSGRRWTLAAAACATLVWPQAARAQSTPSNPAAAPRPGSTVGQPRQDIYTPPPPIRPGEPVSVLVFPFGFADEGAAPAAPGTAPAGLNPAEQHLSGYVTAAVKAGFLSTPAYSLASYSPTSTLVLRGKQSQIVSDTHLTDLVSPKGAVNVEKAKGLTHRLGLQTFLTGNVESKFDAKANSAEVTLDAQLINSSTGEVVRSAAVSGAAVGAEGVPQDVIVERAALDAAQKMLPGLGIELVAPAPEAAEKRRGARRTSRRAAAAPSADRAAALQAKKDAEAAKKAEAKAKRDAEVAARAAAKAERDAARAAEEAAKKARKSGASTGDSASSAVKTPAVPVEAVQQDATPAQPPAATAPPAGAPVVQPALTNPLISTSRGTADATGRPVPYGYATDGKGAVPPRNRNSLRVPTWLGVAGFLAGLSFLL